MRNATVQVGSLTAGHEQQRREQRRSLIFSLGDCLFLIIVGVSTSLMMYLGHSLSMHVVSSRTWHFILSVVVGMSLAMIIQPLLALGVAPLLGSIESMVPSMVVAMIIPMMVCLLDLMQINVSRTGFLALGAAGGIAGFILLKAYGHKCRKCFCCEFPQKEGL